MDFGSRAKQGKSATYAVAWVVTVGGSSSHSHRLRAQTLAGGAMERQMRKTARGRPSREETADESLDRLLEEERMKRAQARAQSERPEVRSVRVGGAEGDGGGQGRHAGLTTGRSAGIDRTVTGTTEMADKYGKFVEQRNGQGGSHGDLLGPLGTPMTLGPVMSGEVGSLRGTWLPDQFLLKGLEKSLQDQFLLDELKVTAEAYIRHLGGQGDHDGGERRHHDGEADRDGGALRRHAGKGKVGAGSQPGMMGPRPRESRELSVNLFPESETGRQHSGGAVPMRSLSPVPTVRVGDEQNPFSAGVNPFWSEDLRRRVVGGEEGAFQEVTGRIPKLPTTYAGLTQADMDELEKIKLEGLREIEQKMIEDKRRSEASSTSYRTLPAVPDVEVEKGVTYAGQAGLGGNTPVQTPPGIPAAWTTGATRPMGESLTESLRNLELPRLDPNTSAIGFGDWLAVVEPLMSDVSSTSAVWWRLIIQGAEDAYQRRLQATPLQRLRLRVVQDPIASQWPRTEQRSVTMLLTAIPDDIRRDLISSRKLNTSEIVFRLFTVFQPGGPEERAQLLKEVSEDGLVATATAGDVLKALRLWRRNVARAGELHLQLPDPLVLTHVLTKWSEHVGRVGGQQVAYRISTLRQALGLDQSHRVCRSSSGRG